MKFTIRTDKLNSILTKVQKGVGNGKMLPVTQYLKIEVSDKRLNVTATNLNNFITGTAYNLVDSVDGEVLVLADTFIKLVGKTTVENMTFEVEVDKLKIKGNGDYSIPFIEGEYPSFEFNYVNEKFKVRNDELQDMFKLNKSAIAHEMEMPCLTGYYMIAEETNEEGEKVAAKCITTDGMKMCINSTELTNNTMLVSQELADLLSTMDAEFVGIQADENKLLFTTENITIFGSELSGKETYPDITPVLDFEYPNKVTLNRAQLLNALDRISLFVTPFDNNAIRLQYNKGELIISDLNSKSIEIVKYLEDSHYGDGSLLCNLVYLQNLLTVVPTETVTIDYNHESTLRIAEGKVCQILSLMNQQN